MRSFLIFFILVCTLTGMAQPNLDSMRQAASMAQDPQNQISAYISYGMATSRRMTDTLRAVAQKIGAISPTYQGAPIGSIQDYLVGSAFFRERNLDSSFYYFQRSIPGIKQVEDERLKSNVFADMAMSYSRAGFIESAVHYSKLALPIAKRANPKILKKINGNLGIFYRKAGAWDLSIESFEKVLSLPNVNTIDTVLARMSIGDIYMEVGDVERAVRLFKETLPISPDASQFRASLHGNLAAAYNKLEQYDSALIHLNKGFEVIKRADNAKQLILSNRLRAADIYIMKGEFAEAKEALELAKASPIRSRGVENLLLKYVEAKIYFHEEEYENVIAAGSSIMDNVTRLAAADTEIKFREFFQIMIDSYEKLGRVSEKMAAMQSYIDYLKNTEIDKTRRELADLKVAYEIQEKEQALASSTEALALNKKINLLLTVSIGATILALLALGFTYRSVRSKNKLLENQNEKIKVLIRELHHRVKNNLQVISSLLGLQSLKIEGEEAKAAFDEGKSRVNAMAMIHKKLYQENDLEKVNINEYLEELINNLKFSFDTSSKVEVHMDVAKAQFNMDKAIPVGLILNELITNSFKYAFEEIEKPILDIKLIQNQNQFELTISDNGKAIEQSESVEQSDSFGLRLVNLLVQQLNGQLSFSQSANLKTFSIQFQ